MSGIDLLIKPASSLCNLKCKYCFYSDVSHCRDVESYGIMTAQTQETLVRKALDYADEYCIFAFQGGEPTLAGLDFYKRQIELQRKYNKKGVQISNAIQTNGCLIDEKWAAFLAENHFLVGLSLDGPKQIHDAMRTDAAGNGSFDRVMQTLRLFNRYNVEYNILTVVNSLVAKNARRVYSFFRDMNLKYLQFIECLDPFDNSRQDYSLDSRGLEKFLKAAFDEYYKDFQNGCYTSVRIFDNFVFVIAGKMPETCGMTGKCTAYQLVEANGDIYPCDFYVLDRYLVGNIHKDSFRSLVCSKVNDDFVAESYYMARECGDCEWYRLCRGGCKRYREPFINEKPGLNRFCEAYKGFFDYAYPRMKKMADSFSSGSYRSRV